MEEGEREVLSPPPKKEVYKWILIQSFWGVENKDTIQGCHTFLGFGLFIVSI